ncbi:MAG TPA: APC family permease [Candidatus Saccharimonadales bacterium]|jgi:APA family basic amino acid/polyamine antiporter|nr:APC family permease [Candidatus Saccharimonadales bacterium]
MTQLARTLRTIDYFTLGFGTMVGVGWLILMDDWLQRGGPMGAVLGFLLGGIILLPIGYVYGQLVMAIPDAGGELAFTAKVFPPLVGYITAWTMMLAYLIVCPWEAVAVGRILAFIFPQLDSIELYRVAGQPVYLPHLALGLALTALITWINYRGIQLSARFQNWTTFGLAGLFVVFISAGLAKGTPTNLAPPFSHSVLVSVFLVLQIVPYFMTGFESVAKCAEEANPEFRSRGFFRAILAALLTGTVFYCTIIFVAGYAHPWQQLIGKPFPTAYALQHLLGGQWIVKLILIAALLSLLKVFNGNFVAATRLLFALGRRGMVGNAVAYIHPRNQSPAIAAVAIGLLTAAGVFMGRAILVPITEVGSMASACGWLAACAAYFFLATSTRERMIAFAGEGVALGLIAMKVMPLVPGHFTQFEWLAFLLWLALGFIVKRRNVNVMNT